MKKLISSLAEIPFSIIAQQFPEAPVYFYAIKMILSNMINQNGYKRILAMDMKTHGCSFTTEKQIAITKVGYKGWKSGLVYSISLWQVGIDHSLSTSFISSRNTDIVEFFPLDNPLIIESGKTYYITRTYIESDGNNNQNDCVGWLNSKENGSICPVKQQTLTLINGFFSDDINPLQSERMSNIRTTTLLPFIDFEYMLVYP